MKVLSRILITAMTAWFMPSIASQPLNLDGINSTYLQLEPIMFNGSATTDYVGGIQGSLNGNNEFFWCYDLRNVIYVPGNYQVNPTKPNATFAPFLQLPSAFNLEVTSSMLNHANIASFGTNTDKYVALQLATWSVLYNWTLSNHPTNTLGGPTNLFSAPLITNTTILNDAYGFLRIANGFVLNGTYGSSYGAYKVLVNAASSPGNVIQTLAGVGVPEPTTYLVMSSFLGLGALLMRQRKLRKCVPSES